MTSKVFQRHEAKRNGKHRLQVADAPEMVGVPVFVFTCSKCRKYLYINKEMMRGALLQGVLFPKHQPHTEATLNWLECDA